MSEGSKTPEEVSGIGVPETESKRTVLRPQSAEAIRRGLKKAGLSMDEPLDPNVNLTEEVDRREAVHQRYLTSQAIRSRSKNQKK